MKFSLERLQKAKAVAEQAKETAAIEEVQHPFLRKGDQGDVVVTVTLAKLKERLRTARPEDLRRMEEANVRSGRIEELLRVFGPKIREVSVDPRTKKPNAKVDQVLSLLEQALKALDNN